MSLDSPLKLLKKNWERRATVHADGSAAIGRGSGSGSGSGSGDKGADKDAGNNTENKEKEKEKRRKGSTSRRWSLVPRMRGPSPASLRKHFRGREGVEEVKAAEVTAVE